MSRGPVTVAAGYVGGGVLIFGSILTGHASVAVFLTFAAIGAVLTGIGLDVRDENRVTEGFNRLAAEYGGLSKHDMRRMRAGLEPICKGLPATGPAVAPGPAKPAGPAVLLCESCELQPATVGVLVDGQPFRVCDGCVPVPAFRDAGSSTVGVLVAAPVVLGGVIGLAWAVGRLGDLAVPLKLLAGVGVVLGVIGLAVGGVVVSAVAAGGALYALDKGAERRVLPTVTVQAVTAHRAPDVLGQVVAGEVVREVTR